MLTLVDDYSRRHWVYLLREKSDVGECIKAWLPRAEKEAGEKLSKLRTDRGGEFMSHQLQAFSDQIGVAHQTTAPYSWQ